MKTRQLCGLSQEEVDGLRKLHGYNLLPSNAAETLLQKIARQFQNPLIYILLFALAFDLVVWAYEGSEGVPFESIIISFILVLNAFLGAWQEHKSDKALERLKSFAAPYSWVVRDNNIKKIPSAEILPGDVVRVEAGDRIPADGQALQSQGLMVDESTLTGESVPLDKAEGNSLYSGTLAVRGRSLLLVSAIGVNSNMGKLANMLGEIKHEKTPLEKKMDLFGNLVAACILVIAGFILVTGVYLSGVNQFGEIFLFAVALAVAAVPESLPAVMTLTLALGVERMAKKQAVVKRLSAVEALGSVTIIATDKTGTLTENQMEVRKIDVINDETALMAMVIANDAELDEHAGDPLELGLLTYASQRALNIGQLLEQCPRVSTKPFDSKWKFMRVSVKQENNVISYFKGAPDVLLDMCEISSSEKKIGSIK